MLALPAKLFSGKVGLLKTTSSIWRRFWQVRFRLVSQTSFQNQSMVVEPIEIQGVWRNAKRLTPRAATVLSVKAVVVFIQLEVEPVTGEKAAGLASWHSGW
jgi:hypothetical protein